MTRQEHDYYGHPRDSNCCPRFERASVWSLAVDVEIVEVEREAPEPWALLWKACVSGCAFRAELQTDCSDVLEPLRLLGDEEVVNVVLMSETPGLGSVEGFYRLRSELLRYNERA